MSFPLFLISSNIEFSENLSNTPLLHKLRQYPITQKVHNKLSVYNYVHIPLSVPDSIHLKNQAVVYFSSNPPTEDKSFSFIIYYYKRFRENDRRSQNKKNATMTITIASDIDAIIRKQMELDTESVFQSLMLSFSNLTSNRIMIKSLYKLNVDVEDVLQYMQKSLDSSVDQLPNIDIASDTIPSHNEIHYAEDLQSYIDLQHLKVIYNTQSHEHDERDESDNDGGQIYVNYDRKLSKNKQIRCMTTRAYINSGGSTSTDQLCLTEIERILCNIIKQHKWSATQLKNGKVNYAHWKTIQSTIEYFRNKITDIETKICAIVNQSNVYEELLIYSNIVHRYKPTFILPLFIKQYNIVLSENNGVSRSYLDLLWRNFKSQKNTTIQPIRTKTIAKSAQFWDFLKRTGTQEPKFSIKEFSSQYPIETINQYRNTFLYLVFYHNITVTNDEDATVLSENGTKSNVYDENDQKTNYTNYTVVV